MCNHTHMHLTLIQGTYCMAAGRPVCSRQRFIPTLHTNNALQSTKHNGMCDLGIVLISYSPAGQTVCPLWLVSHAAGAICVL
jgi:hypothetical protein